MSNISLNFTEVKNITDGINNKVTNYYTELNKEITTNFQGLRALGLFTEGFTKLEDNMKDVANSTNMLTSTVDNHINYDIDMENEITNYINSKGDNCILNVDHSTGTVNGTVDYTNITVKTVTKGKPISAETLSKTIPDFTEASKKILLESINTNSGKDTFSELLFNEEKAVDLYRITKAAVGDTRNSVGEPTGTKDLQNTILDTVMETTEDVLDESNEKSMIVGLPYLDKYASNLDTNLIDLLYSENREVDLMNGLNDLYNGINVDKYGFSSKNYDSYKTFIDTLASQNGITSETLLSDTSYLDIIRRGVE